MDEEEGMIVQDNDIDEGGHISDHKNGSKESKEQKVGGYSEVESGSDDCGDNKGGDVEKEEKQSQEDPEGKYQ